MHSLRVQIFSFIAAILLILLLLLNTYPMTSSRDMVCEEKHSAMSGQATVIASSLSGLDRLTKESVAEVLRILDIGGYVRTVVTDEDGLVLYDDGGTVDEKFLGTRGSGRASLRGDDCGRDRGAKARRSEAGRQRFSASPPRPSS